MRYQARQWMGIVLASLFLLSGATARVHALTATLTTTKGCTSDANNPIIYNVGESFQILLQTDTNATGTLTLTRPDGTFTIFSNAALNANTQYFLNRQVAAADASSTACGARTLTLVVNTGGTTPQSVTKTCSYTVPCQNVGGSVGVNLTITGGCGASVSPGSTIQILFTVQQTGGTFTASLTDTYPDNSVHTVFSNQIVTGGTQYQLLGGYNTTGLPAGTHTLKIHVVSNDTPGLTGDQTCTFTLGQVGGAIATDVHTDKGCSTNANTVTYNVGQQLTVFVQAGQTVSATLTETIGSTTNVIFQNVILQAGVQYFVTGTAAAPTGARNLHLHVVSTTNSALTGDDDCAFSVGGSVGGTVTVDLHTNKGCNQGTTVVHFAQGEANTIFFTVGRNSMVNLTVTRPDGTFSILSNFAATGGVQYFINSSIAGINGNRTLTLNATATDGTGDTGQGTCSYTVP